jgi:hypothetical protein
LVHVLLSCFTTVHIHAQSEFDYVFQTLAID